MIEIDGKTGETIVGLLQQIAEQLTTIAAEVTILSRAVDRAVAPPGSAHLGADPPQAREFLKRPVRR